MHVIYHRVVDGVIMKQSVLRVVQLHLVAVIHGVLQWAVAVYLIRESAPYNYLACDAIDHD